MKLVRLGGLSSACRWVADVRLWFFFGGCSNRAPDSSIQCAVMQDDPCSRQSLPVVSCGRS